MDVSTGGSGRGRGEWRTVNGDGVETAWRRRGVGVGVGKGPREAILEYCSVQDWTGLDCTYCTVVVGPRTVTPWQRPTTAAAPPSLAYLGVYTKVLTTNYSEQHLACIEKHCCTGLTVRLLYCGEHNASVCTVYSRILVNKEVEATRYKIAKRERRLRS